MSQRGPSAVEIGLAMRDYREVKILEGCPKCFRFMSLVKIKGRPNSFYTMSSNFIEKLVYKQASNSQSETTSLYWSQDNYTIKNWFKKNDLKIYRIQQIENTGHAMQNKWFLSTKEVMKTSIFRIMCFALIKYIPVCMWA